MGMLRLLALLLLMGVSALAQSPTYGVGRPPTPDEIRALGAAIAPDGEGLPAGSGTVAAGREVFAAQCSRCHGPNGEGGVGATLVGGQGTLRSARPLKTVGSYWPYATTLWDYINRAMPFQAPRTLSAAEVYALTAYVLNLNNIVPDDFVADRNSLPKVKMPNHDHFIWQDPRPDTAIEACMTNCRHPEDVQVTSSAEGKDLTPRTTGPLDDMRPK